MASTFHLQIITPDRILCDEEVESLVVTTCDGQMGILARHIPLITPLDTGIIKIKKNGQIKTAVSSSGFVQVGPEGTRVVIDAAEWPEEIDVERAEAAKRRAEERIGSEESNVDKTKAGNALQRAVNRLRMAGRL
ncbi:MAG: ATP synthase F1 subunit epsilon [Alkaliphilus sp.]|nr:ATP synthase F1 subunit epsilon [Alkaliphilus sp.]